MLTQQSISIQPHYVQYLFSNALTQQPNDSVKDDDDDDDDRTSLISQSSSCLCAASGVGNAITSVKLLFFMFLTVEANRKKGATDIMRLLSVNNALIVQVERRPVMLYLTVLRSAVRS